MRFFGLFNSSEYVKIYDFEKPTNCPADIIKKNFRKPLAKFIYDFFSNVKVYSEVDFCVSVRPC